MANYSIKIKNLSKRYRINLKNETKDTFIGAIGSMIMSPYNNLKRIRNLTQVNEKSNNYKDTMSDIIDKKNNYLMKIFFSLITLRLKKFVYYFARYTAILKFNNFLKKN